MRSFIAAASAARSRFGDRFVDDFELEDLLHLCPPPPRPPGGRGGGGAVSVIGSSTTSSWKIGCISVHQPPSDPPGGGACIDFIRQSRSPTRGCEQTCAAKARRKL